MNSTALLLIACCTAAATAEDPDSQAARWNQAEEQIVGLLESSEFKKAEEAASKLGEDYLQNANGERWRDYFARLFVYQAVAAAGAKRQVEAEWFWQSARIINPGVGASQFPRLVGVLEPLSASAPSSRPKTIDGDEVVTAEEGQAASGKRLRRPKRGCVPQPARPRFPGWNTTVTVTVTIGKDGVARYAAISNAQALPAAIKYSLLNTIRLWRWRPAEVNGKPKPSLVAATVRFSYD